MIAGSHSIYDALRSEGKLVRGECLGPDEAGFVGFADCEGCGT
jgi:hypothetical protein